MNRKVIFSFIVLAQTAIMTAGSTTDNDKTVSNLPVPTRQQMEWQQMEQYAFLHYSINTYTDQEWGFGDEPASLFNPTRLDVRQWARVCKESGMQGIILTAKHHCGFCLWPSKYTEYSVKNAPWKNGKGDIVRELADACKEYGLKFAVYLSPWDRNHAQYGEKEYIEYFRHQLHELLTEYGNVFEVWFDGANGGTGYYGGANEKRQIDRRTYYEWDETYRLIRQWQPDCMIWNDGGKRGDLRWVGTEDGYVGQPNWSMLMSTGDVPYEQLHHGVENGDVWVPGEVNTSIRPGWFWHERENKKVKTLQHLMDTYYKSVGRNGTLLLNFPITPEGRIDTADSITGAAFGHYIQELFSNNLAKNAKIKTKGMTTTLTLKKATTVNRILLQEEIEKGQRVKRFMVEALVDGQWKELHDELLPEGEPLTTIGYKRIICFPTITSRQFRVTILDSKDEPLLKNIALYLAPEIIEPLTHDVTDDDYLPTNGWRALVAVSELDWRKAFDQHDFSVFTLPQGQMSLTIDMRETITTSGFTYLPSRKTKQGLIVAYVVSVSEDGQIWRDVAEGEFSNIENNPIRQTVPFPTTTARYVRLTATRLLQGDTPTIADFKLIPAK